METLKTKAGNEINLQCFDLKEDIVKARLFDTSVIQASVNDEVVGYVKLAYIGPEKANKLAEPFDYFIYKIYGSDEKIVEAYESYNIKYLLEKLALRDLKITQENFNSLSKNQINELFDQFKESINQTYKNQFNTMIDYWVNKPSIELIRVFSDKDDSYTDYSQPGYPSIERQNNKNWQGQRVGAALYESAAKWCHSKGLELWGSTTRTEDAKRMWKIMENMPKFFVIMTEVCKYSSTGQILSKTERPKLNIKEFA
jgi:hypothetical protein